MVRVVLSRSTERVLGEFSIPGNVSLAGEANRVALKEFNVAIDVVLKLPLGHVKASAVVADSALEALLQCVDHLALTYGWAESALAGSVSCVVDISSRIVVEDIFPGKDRLESPSTMASKAQKVKMMLTRSPGRVFIP
jgi:hypothetical protein